MTGYSGCYRFSNRTIPKRLFYFYLITPLVFHTLSYLSFTLAIPAFSYPFTHYIFTAVRYLLLSVVLITPD